MQFWSVFGGQFGQMDSAQTQHQGAGQTMDIQETCVWRLGTSLFGGKTVRILRISGFNYEVTTGQNSTV